MGGSLGQLEELHGIPECIPLQARGTQDRVLEGNGDRGFIGPQLRPLVLRDELDFS